MNYPQNMDEAMEAHEQRMADIQRRNLAIAKFLGWYQKNPDLNVWFIKDGDREDMVWTPLYTSPDKLPYDMLPFWHDLNMLNIVMEVLPNELGFNVREIPIQEDKWYTTLCMMSPVGFSCFLFKANGQGGYADARMVEYTVGINVGSYHEGLFMFLSDIILIMQNKSDEQPK